MGRGLSKQQREVLEIMDVLCWQHDPDTPKHMQSQLPKGLRVKHILHHMYGENATRSQVASLSRTLQRLWERDLVRAFAPELGFQRNGYWYHLTKYCNG